MKFTADQFLAEANHHANELAEMLEDAAGMAILREQAKGAQGEVVGYAQDDAVRDLKAGRIDMIRLTRTRGNGDVALYTATGAAVPDERDAEIARLNAIINTPQSDDFLRAVSTEAEHQRQRWGNEHDSGKKPSDWFWLIGYLGGKALHAHAEGNAEKAEHHIITTAAACANWHRALFGQTDMRPGIDGEAILSAAPTDGGEQGVGHE